ncbi:hypothetical protein B0H13DRAFT_1915405 [Mycena leptocephala]|nr:hypothetical protein B0H13DRAFT_1915405 [Mycena leptocephala]
MLENSWKLFTRYIFVEAQQDGNRIMQLFRNNEMSNLLKDCHAGLDQAMKSLERLNRYLQISTGAAIFNDIDDMKKAANYMHEELLGLIETLSDASTISDRSSLKFIFNVAVNAEDLPCAESATTSLELAALIGLHVGLSPGQDLTKPVVQYISKKPSCLLILDNLETVWEPIQSRGGVEEFLSLLTAVKHLALIITMRGAERPAKVRWTHPFLLPLQPLSDEAAHQTFMDITDGVYATKDINQLLRFTDNMPLAVDLIAHLVDYEGLINVLARWETEKTSLLSVGYDRKSNLDTSISLSLSSPRITSDSKELLSLLSILPNGLSDAELVQSNLPIPNILSCKAALQATSLVYQDGNKRLLSLMPVREHIQQFLPPSQSLIQSLCKHFYSVLELYQKYDGEQLQPVMNQITSNLRNLQEVLQRCLSENDLNLADTVYCILCLNSFYRVTGRGHIPLMDSIKPILPHPCNHQLEIHLLTEVLKSSGYYPSHMLEKMIVQGVSHFQCLSDPLLESKFYQAAGIYFFNYKLDSLQAMVFYQKALELSKLSGDSNQWCSVLLSLAWLKYQTGDPCTAQEHASEAQRLSKLSANLYQEASAYWVGAICSKRLGDYQKSMAQLHRARQIVVLCGLCGGILDHDITLTQAEIHRMKSEYAQARTLNSQLVETTSPDHDAFSYAISLLNIAHIDTRIGGDIADVYQTLDKAKDIFSSYDSLRGNTSCSMAQADVELREGNFDLAKVKFQECLHLAWGTDIEAESFCLERLANVKAWQAIGSQHIWAVVYVGHAHISQDKLALHKALLFLGDVFSAHTDEETALSLYTVALEGFTHMDVHCSRAQCMLCLGDLAIKQGNTSAAIAHWKAARPLFEKSLQAKDVAQIESRLANIEEAHQEALVKLTTLQPPVQLLQQLSISREEMSEAEKGRM